VTLSDEEIGGPFLKEKKFLKEEGVGEKKRRALMRGGGVRHVPKGEGISLSKSYSIQCREDVFFAVWRRWESGEEAPSLGKEPYRTLKGRSLEKRSEDERGEFGGRVTKGVQIP